MLQSVSLVLHESTALSAYVPWHSHIYCFSISGTDSQHKNIVHFGICPTMPSWHKPSRRSLLCSVQHMNTGPLGSASTRIQPFGHNPTMPSWIAITYRSLLCSVQHMKTGLLDSASTRTRPFGHISNNAQLILQSLRGHYYARCSTWKRAFWTAQAQEYGPLGIYPTMPS